MMLLLGVWAALLAKVPCGAAEYNLAGRPGEGYVVEVRIGHPPQQLNVLIDTGSTNFAVAGDLSANIDTYFHREVSSTYLDLRTEVSVLYTQGSWSGQLASDFVYFPTLNWVPEVRCDIALITEAENFFMNGSNWQGILGVAYPAISRPDSGVLSWIDSLQQSNKDRTMAFSLTLCGASNDHYTQHYGSFEILNNVVHTMEGLMTTPVVKDWFYEVVLTGLAVGGVPLDVDCLELNADRTIVDSGTTNIRVPDAIFRKLVEAVRAKTDLLPAPGAFWYGGEAVCRARPLRRHRLPPLSLQLLHSEREYFTIELPGSSYVRRVAAATVRGGREEYCYKLGIESSASGSILGVAAMEGLEVIFNRTGRTVGFRASACGPNVTVRGPTTGDAARCLRRPRDRPTMLEVAAYVVCATLVAATLMFLYLLLQWLREKYFRCHVAGAVSLSHTSLINEEH